MLNTLDRLQGTHNPCKNTEIVLSFFFIDSDIVSLIRSENALRFVSPALIPPEGQLAQFGRVLGAAGTAPCDNRVKVLYLLSSRPVGPM